MQVYFILFLFTIIIFLFFFLLLSVLFFPDCKVLYVYDCKVLYVYVPLQITLTLFQFRMVYIEYSCKEVWQYVINMIACCISDNICSTLGHSRCISIQI